MKLIPVLSETNLLFVAWWSKRIHTVLCFVPRVVLHPEINGLFTWNQSENERDLTAMLSLQVYLMQTIYAKESVTLTSHVTSDNSTKLSALIYEMLGVSFFYYWQRRDVHARSLQVALQGTNDDVHTVIWWSLLGFATISLAMVNTS